MQALFSLCAVSYLLIYAFEGVIRYGLYNVGHDDAILLRDGLVMLPLARAVRHPGFPAARASRVLRIRRHYWSARADRRIEPAHRAAGDLRHQADDQCAVRLHRRTGCWPSRAAVCSGCWPWCGWSRSSAWCWTNSFTRFRGWGSRPMSAASRSMSRAAGISTAASTSAPRALRAARSRRRCCCRPWP